MDGDVSYSLNDDAGRKSPGDIMRFFLMPAHSMRKNLSMISMLALGIYGNYGLGIDFGQWAGDRLIKKSTMVAMTLKPFNRLQIKR